MKVAIFILSVFVASSQAGPFDGLLAVASATSNSLKFSNAVDVEIKAALDLITSSVTQEIAVVNATGQSVVAYVSSFGSGAQTLIDEVTADAAAVSSQISQTFNVTTISNAIMKPYNDVKANVTAVITYDISKLNAQVTSGQIKYSCQKNAQPYIDGNITQYTAKIRQKKTEHYQKFQDQTAALNLEINIAIQTYQQNVTDTCAGLTDAALVTCQVAQGEILRPIINLQIQGLIQEASNDLAVQVSDGQVKSQQLWVDFNTQYGNIKADIVKCSTP